MPLGGSLAASFDLRSEYSWAVMPGVTMSQAVSRARWQVPWYSTCFLRASADVGVFHTQAVQISTLRQRSKRSVFSTVARRISKKRMLCMETEDRGRKDVVGWFSLYQLCASIARPTSEVECSCWRRFEVMREEVVIHQFKIGSYSTTDHHPCLRLILECDAMPPRMNKDGIISCIKVLVHVVMSSA